jgi:hypothetical protein
MDYAGGPIRDTIDRAVTRIETRSPDVRYPNEDLRGGGAVPVCHFAVSNSAISDRAARSNFDSGSITGKLMLRFIRFIHRDAPVLADQG